MRNLNAAAQSAVEKQAKQAGGGSNNGNAAGDWQNNSEPNKTSKTENPDQSNDERKSKPVDADFEVVN